MRKTKLKKGDKVKIIAGKDKGREGMVEKVFPKKEKVLVSGCNIYKKHSRRQGKEGRSSGGIIDIVSPLPYSSVAFICPKCGEPTRIGFKIIGGVGGDGALSKLRICRKCKEVI
ncbi:MAG: 50S ribosomal protein L24 [Patescibacteria group bacterium]